MTTMLCCLGDNVVGGRIRSCALSWVKEMSQPMSIALKVIRIDSLESIRLIKPVFLQKFSHQVGYFEVVQIRKRKVRIAFDA